jgi:hypothetical protein
MLERIGLTQAQIGWIVAISIAMFVVGVVTLPWMLSRIPRDYFLTHSAPLARWKETRPVARLVVLAVRNLIGTAFAILGILMLFAPGQGVLMLLVGLSMMTFPGKRTLELRLIRMKRVLKTINWLRAKSGHEPLVLPERRSRTSFGPQNE